MGLSENFRMLALYNQRMNRQLISVCEELSHEQLHQETHSFFPSIMAYWNHILFGDLIMLQRLVANGLVDVELAILIKLPKATSVNDTFVTTMDELRTVRTIVDSIYLQVTESLSSDDYSKIVSYRTTEGQEIRRSMGAFCQHIFNHQTHHRGQLTCVLSQMGLNFGCTDLPVIVPEEI
ncbi:DinB family protein [Endozoicomonas numazuensis]|uniref:Damage-inducible protein DinB n=1 Tax=Endozoicomonas numazuensis TaxID=1137799 RepID=A0A081NGG3_9GAMM|nr:DinB family protein [Endozoicomonas numazuensis]KEQ17536.1 damage-inducible protein DinB [Endozoicomonas numazuensis]